VIRVLLAEDMHMVRGALVALLNLEPDITVVAEVDSGDVIVSTARDCHPDVAIIDIDLPGMDGLTARRRDATGTCPAVSTLILTSLGRPGTVRRALDVKVNGFILKGRAIAPARGCRAVDRPTGVASSTAISRWPHGRQATARSPPGELEILRLAGQGYTVADIAGELCPVSGHGPQLSRRRGDETERPQPSGRDPDRDRGRMAVTAGQP